MYPEERGWTYARSGPPLFRGVPPLCTGCVARIQREFVRPCRVLGRTVAATSMAPRLRRGGNSASPTGVGGELCGGFEGVPRLASTDDGQTILELSGRLYEAQEYLPAQSHFGRYPASGPLPNVAVHLPCDRRRTIAEAVARFHCSTLHLPPDTDQEVARLPERLGGLATEMNLCHESLLDGARSVSVARSERLPCVGWRSRPSHAGGGA